MKGSEVKRSASASPSRQVKRLKDDSQKTSKTSSDKSSKKDHDKPRRKESNKDVKKPKRESSVSEGEYTGSDSDSSATSYKSKPEPIPGGRYWGGKPDKESNNDNEPTTRSVDTDYEIGKRYYDAKPAVAEEEDLEKKEAETQFLVGKRYYEDKPEDKNDTKTKVEEPKKETVGNVTAPTRRAKLDDPLLSRTGGAYIPPAKLRLMQASITDKSSISYQRIAWEALKKSIHGHINKVNTSNIGIIARLLMKENIVRGRGLLCRSILQAQAASTTFTNVYACLVSVLNSKFPNIGELLMKRVILQFKRGFKRNDKALCIASCQFIAHLVNQQVAHEILALEMLTLLLESPTDDSVEVAVAFLKEVGQKLLELSPKGTNAIFDMLRNILHQGNLEKRVQYMIEVVFQVRKDGFRSFESVDESLDLVEEEDRYTHIITLDEAVDPEDMLNVFKHDLEYELNEDKYKALKEEIIGESSSEEESGEEGSDEESEEEGDGSDEEQEGEAKESKGVTIIDETETNLVALRRTIYLTIQSSLDFEECCHKLLKMDIKPGQEPELCHMLLDCCAELRTYEKFFGLLAQRFCQINRVYIAPLEEMFAGSYATVHRLDTNKLRNVARFFGHLLFTDAISWQVLESVRLNEEDTTSSSRIFIKILFQELAEYMGLAILNQRLKDPTLQTAMEGLFPRDNPKNTRFAINFFTSIGLGGLTDDLREHLKNQPKLSAVAQLVDKLDISTDSSSESSSSSSDSSDSETSSESSSDSEEEEGKKNNKKKNKTKTDNKNKRNQNEKHFSKKEDSNINKKIEDTTNSRKTTNSEESRKKREENSKNGKNIRRSSSEEQCRKKQDKDFKDYNKEYSPRKTSNDKEYKKRQEDDFKRKHKGTRETSNDREYRKRPDETINKKHKEIREISNDREYRKRPDEDTNRKHKGTWEKSNDREYRKIPDEDTNRKHKGISETSNDREYRKRPDEDTNRKHKGISETSNDREYRKRPDEDTNRKHKDISETSNDREYKKRPAEDTNRKHKGTWEKSNDREYKKIPHEDTNRKHKGTSETLNDREYKKRSDEDFKRKYKGAREPSTDKEYRRQDQDFKDCKKEHASRKTSNDKEYKKRQDEDIKNFEKERNRKTSNSKECRKRQDEDIKRKPKGTTRY